MFLSDHQWKFWTFSILYLWKEFSGKRKPFSKNWRTDFLLKVLRLRTHHFHSELPCQKPMLRQIEWWVQNGPITKNGVFPVAILFFWKFCFSLGARSKELIRSGYDVPTTQMFIFILFVSAGVWFEGAFSLWVSLSKYVQHKVTWIWACTILIYGGIC